MLSPNEADYFKKVVMVCYGNLEFRKNWERLRKLTLDNEKAYWVFVSDVREIVWDRLPLNVEVK